MVEDVEEETMERDGNQGTSEAECTANTKEKTTMLTASTPTTVHSTTITNMNGYGPSINGGGISYVSPGMVGSSSHSLSFWESLNSSFQISNLTLTMLHGEITRSQLQPGL